MARATDYGALAYGYYLASTQTWLSADVLVRSAVTAGLRTAPSAKHLIALIC